MTTARGKTVSQVQEPYAIVNGCDGTGTFTLIGVYPNNSKRGDFSIYSILAQIVNGVQIGFIKPRFNVADCWELATQDGNYAIRITLAEALVLFLDPLVARTNECLLRRFRSFDGGSSTVDRVLRDVRIL
jgi:hypothetical protein